MKTFLFILLCFLLVACSNTSSELEDEIIDEDTNPVIIDEDSKPSKTIVLDPEFTGLVNLPLDDGGEHKAYPEGSNPNVGLGYYVYTPGGYYDNELEYPIILFLHGSGQSGTREFPQLLINVLEHGPPKLIENKNWNPRYPSLVVSPQVYDGDWSPSLVHSFIEDIIANYRVNTKRIYITGLSMGARGCWFYEAEKGNESYAAALVPICGRGQTASLENLGNIPIWAFHGTDDTVVKAFSNNGSVQMVTAINAINPKYKAKLTMYPGVAHDSWPRTYDSSGMGTESLEYDPFDMTIYDWMFQFRKE